MMLNFCLYFDIHRNSKSSQSFQLGVVTHVWAFPKSCQIVIQCHLKNELSHEWFFLHVISDYFKWMWSDMHKLTENKLVISKIKISMSVIFDMWLGIHNYIYIIQFSHMEIL